MRSIERTERLMSGPLLASALIMAALSLHGCGGVTGSTTSVTADTAPLGAAPAAPAAPAALSVPAESSAIDPPAVPTLTSAGASGSLKLAWSASAGATSYVVQKRLGDAGAWTDDGIALAATATATELKVPVVEWNSARYRVNACNAAGCAASSEIAAKSQMEATVSVAKPGGFIAGPSNGGAWPYSFAGEFGMAIAVSDDGDTMVVGGPSDGSGGIGVNGSQTASWIMGSRNGAAYVFVRSGGVWSQQAYLKPAFWGSIEDSCFGKSVALAADGNTLVVGRSGCLDTGVVGDVSVYVRSGTTWSLQATLVTPDAGTDLFGLSVALSADGNTLVAGAGQMFSGVGGQVYVFRRSGSAWAQTAAISDPDGTRMFGAGVQVDAAGRTIAVVENSRAYVFAFDGTTWTRELRVPIDAGSDSISLFAQRMAALSSDGQTLVVGSPSAGGGRGDVRVFDRATGWSEQARLTPPNAGGWFGLAVSLSRDGRSLLVGAPMEASAATGLDGDMADTTNPAGGAVYAFTRIGTTWTYRAYIKATRGDASRFGAGIGQSADGSTIGIGAPNDRGVNQTSDFWPYGGGTGAVFVY